MLRLFSRRNKRQVVTEKKYFADLNPIKNKSNRIFA